MFGQHVLDLQNVSFRLCELETEVESLHSLVYGAAEPVQGRGAEEVPTAAFTKAKSGQAASVTEPPIA
ncbi:acyl-CoA dehydrogenase family protein [Bradyrhizobium macuxiense]|uniref:acyl-CoA dehydrogenase family protein n=1 Tax=Bradyrhizobium macuxiense TaxID=1755647 RepID=UPI0011BF0EEC